MDGTGSRTNHFDAFVRRISSKAPAHLHAALLDVTDTAYACRLWFESNAPAATPADIVAMTGLVMEREAELRASDTPDDADAEPPSLQAIPTRSARAR